MLATAFKLSAWQGDFLVQWHLIRRHGALGPMRTKVNTDWASLACKKKMAAKHKKKNRNSLLAMEPPCGAWKIILKKYYTSYTPRAPHSDSPKTEWPWPASSLKKSLATNQIIMHSKTISLVHRTTWTHYLCVPQFLVSNLFFCASRFAGCQACKLAKVWCIIVKYFLSALTLLQPIQIQKAYLSFSLVPCSLAV